MIDLQNDLQGKGVLTKGTQDKVQGCCKNKDMPIEEEIAETEKGWEGHVASPLGERLHQSCKEEGRR
jgi:hypothetical protein